MVPPLVSLIPSWSSAALPKQSFSIFPALNFSPLSFLLLPAPSPHPPAPTPFLLPRSRSGPKTIELRTYYRADQASFSRFRYMLYASIRSLARSGYTTTSKFWTRPVRSTLSVTSWNHHVEYERGGGLLTTCSKAIWWFDKHEIVQRLQSQKAWAKWLHNKLYSNMSKEINFCPNFLENCHRYLHITKMRSKFLLLKLFKRTMKLQKYLCLAFTQRFVEIAWFLFVDRRHFCLLSLSLWAVENAGVDLAGW